jgi:copper chaperone CopZ
VGRLASAIERRQQEARTTPATSQTPETPNQSAGSQLAVFETVTVKVEGMTCTACEVPIRDALSRTQGVVSADVSHQRGDARVRYDPSKTTVDQIRRAINSTGYKAK